MRFIEKFRHVCRAEGKPHTTFKSYWAIARQFVRWAEAKSEDDLKVDAPNRFREFLADELNRGVSRSTYRQSRYALQMMFERVLTVPLGDLSNLPWPPNHEVMVNVPPIDLAFAIVQAMPGMSGTVGRTQLSGALRISDALRIRCKDLDFRRKMIAIQRSKGGTSRFVPMDESLAPELEALLRERERRHKLDLAAGLGWVSLPGLLEKKYKGQEYSLDWQWLFFAPNISTDPETGNRGRFHLLPAAVQRAFARARISLGIYTHYTPHCLRHATAQFWEASRVPHSDIQRLMGHKDLQTTQRYLSSGRSGVPRNLPTPQNCFARQQLPVFVPAILTPTPNLPAVKMEPKRIGFQNQLANTNANHH